MTYQEDRERSTESESLEYEVRPVEPGEFRTFSAAERLANGIVAGEEYICAEERITDLDRTLAVFEGGNLVATSSSQAMEMAVPGGWLPTAGIANVSVQPTHRRRGLLRLTMERQLRDIHERGEPLAALRTTESGIYGRFGFGIASFQEDWAIDRRHAAFARSPCIRGACRLVDPDRAAELFPWVYSRVGRVRAGMARRNTGLWDLRLRDIEVERRGGSPYFHVVYGGPEAEGYVLYRVQGDTLVVHELVDATDEAHAALWRFCLDADLIATIEAINQPVDDPLLWMLADPRRLRRRPRDGLWLRLIDVPAALSARRYARDGRVVIEVSDPFLSWNQGRYRLEGGPGGSECRPTRDEPDLVLSAADLGALYFGAVRSTTLSQAGRVAVRDPSALATVDSMFIADVQPWNGDNF